MRRSIFFNVLIFSQSILLSQFSFNGDSQMKYGESKNGFVYSENLINTNLQFGNFSNWIQFEFSDPPELGRPYSGLRKIRLEFQQGPIGLLLGDIYNIWGRGLLLNQFDDQGVDIDNGLSGLNFKYINDKYNVNLMHGKADIWKLEGGEDDRIPIYKLHHNILALDIETYVENITLGFSYLQSIVFQPYSPLDFIKDTLNLTHKLLGFRSEYVGKNFDLYGEYVGKTTHHNYTIHKHSIESEVDSIASNGYGFFSNINYYAGDWSLSFDYKYYNFIQLSPDDRGDFSKNYGGVTDFQMPPIAVREHSSTLLGRISHQVDFNDEIGYQIEVFGPIKDWFTLLLNYSQASRRNIWEGALGEWIPKSSAEIFPLTNPAANPFQEVYAEIEGYGFDGNFHYQVGAGFTKDLPSLWINSKTDSIHELQYQLIKAVTVPTSFDVSLSNGWSMEMKLEYQQLTHGTWHYFKQNSEVMTDSLYPSEFEDDEEKQNNSIVSIGIGKSPTWALSLIIDAVSVDEKGNLGESETNPLERLMGNVMDIDKKCISLELACNITPTHRLSLMYGTQRGGLVCSNGICRIIPPFDDGFKVNLTSIF